MLGQSPVVCRLENTKLALVRHYASEREKILFAGQEYDYSSQLYWKAANLRTGNRSVKYVNWEKTGRLSILEGNIGRDQLR